MIVLGRTQPLALVRAASPRAIRAVYLLTLQISSKAPVNPESGMLVNLTQIDAWMAQVIAKFAEREFGREADVLRALKKEFSLRAAVHAVSLSLEDVVWRIDANDGVSAEVRRIHRHVRGEQEEQSPEIWIYNDPAADWTAAHALRGAASHIWREDPLRQISFTV